MKKMVFKSTMEDDRSRTKAMKAVAECGVDSITTDMKEGKITVVGEADPVRLAKKLRKLGYRAELLSVEEKKEEKKPAAEKKPEEKKPAAEKKPAEEKKAAQPAVATVVYHLSPQSGSWPSEGYPYSYTIVRDEYPTVCTIM
uniref:HMA domain-containing protein n=1 Tax=Picea sitchensis TaxID=3332 RepID=A9NQT6_PICSI|nr:unknown [Picea sitchensis]